MRRAARLTSPSGPDADRKIDSGFDQVDGVLADNEVERDLREAGHEFGQRRDQRVRRECRSQAHPHAAARRAAEAHDVGLRIRDLADDPLHALEVDLAFRRQREAARRALQQAHAEPALEAGHEFRHGGGGDAEIVCRGREAVAFDGANEREHRQTGFHRSPRQKAIDAIMAQML